MADSANPLVEMMKRIRLEIYDRMWRGTLNYKGDMATLQNHLKLAQDIGDPELIVQTYNVIGAVELDVSNFESAETYLKQGYALAESAAHDGAMAISQNNLGEVYRRQGRLQEAIQAFQLGKQHGEKINNSRRIAVSECNTGLVWLALGAYTQAKSHFLQVIEITRDDPWSHISALIETHTGLAEAYLGLGDLETAWKEVNEAARLADGRDFAVMLAHTNLTRAHLAERDPDHPTPAREYYRQAREGLREHGTPIHLARTLLDEARYQLRHGNRDEVQRLASEARTMFEALGLTREAELTTSLAEES